jgi:hypothetical protein
VSIPGALEPEQPDDESPKLRYFVDSVLSMAFGGF